VPFAIFVGWRPVRLAAAGILTGFQIANAATANYGFFCYLATALHVFLLDDADVERATAWLRGRLRLPAPASIGEASGASRDASPEPVARGMPASIVVTPMRRWRRAVAVVGFSAFVALSLVDGLVNFVDSPRLLETLLKVRRLYEPLRIINTYHLFGSITRGRIEPDFQTSDDGEHWTSQELRHKPGDPTRRPDWVAPHQPRVDFQLWFYGLQYRSGAPEYVAGLIERLCKDSLAVQPLFRTPLSPHPKAARIVFWEYHFSTAGERRASGAWWTRQPVDVTDAVACDSAFVEGSGASEE
jgi:hypothetical protein